MNESVTSPVSQRFLCCVAEGTTSDRSLASALLGSVAWQVLRLARTPALTVRAPKRELANA